MASLPFVLETPSRPRRSRLPRSMSAMLLLAIVSGAGCGSGKGTKVTYHDANMDFSQIQRVAVMPFANLTPMTQAADRVRDVFMTMLQATGSLYVLPPGEIQRGVGRARVANPLQPTGDEAIALGKEIKADVVITGTVREYGEVRSGNTTANVVAVSAQMIETQSGKVVWSASSSKGGVSAGDRLLGGRGEPMNAVTEKAVRDLIDKLFK